MMFAISFMIASAFLWVPHAQAAPVCSSNNNQACGYTDNCQQYSAGRLCEKNVSCNPDGSSANNVYKCTLVSGSLKWVYDHWTATGTCNFCGAAPTSTPTPKPTNTPAPKPTATPTPKLTASPTPKPTGTPVPTKTVTPTPQPTSSLLPADVNRNGCINIIDFNLWLQAFKGQPVPNTFPDINNDGKVDLLDFNAWLTTIQQLFNNNPNDPRLCSN